MKLYQVQLETSDRVCSVEVFSPGFDAIELAKRHMSKKHGEEWKQAHVGGFCCIGEDPERIYPCVMEETWGV